MGAHLNLLCVRLVSLSFSSLAAEDSIPSSSTPGAVRSKEQFAQVTVDIKRFGHLMQGQFAPTKVICSELNHFLNLKVYLYSILNLHHRYHQWSGIAGVSPS